jgi:Protein of unknown function (DUF4239)
MLNITEDFLIIIATICASLFFMMSLNRFWPSESRRAHNELIGWHLSILATTYAVIIGFMLYAVWLDFGAAELNADAEANAMVNVFRLAEGLPDQQRDELRSEARSYADAVIDHEWQAMANNQSLNETYELTQKMWRTLMSVKAASPAELTAEDHALYELSAMTEHRRIRWLQCSSRLPTILWCVLLVGGVVTVASTCMFGSTSLWVHGIQVFAFSLLISLVLVAIADIDRPFQGSVHVSESAFLRARESMRQ